MIGKQKDVYVCFIDYSKAFDTVKHEPLIELLQSLDIDPQDVKLLANLYWNQQVVVRHNGEISESISIKQGVRQGCVASPHLFDPHISYTEHVTNVEVLRRANTKRKLLSEMVNRQVKFFGHVMRKEEMENLVTTGYVEGKRARGRQREPT